MINFLLVVTGYNCFDKVARCYRSILAQSYPYWKAVMISDGSTDKTNEYLRLLVNPSIITEVHAKNEGAAFRRYNAIHNYGSSKDVIVFIGMDDEIMPNCLERIKREYDKGKWMTYGNWISQHGKGLPANFRIEFDEQTHLTRDYRKVCYRSTAPNTFYKFLFEKIPMEDFQIDGKWIDSTTESEVMYSCLEMCGKGRIGVIHDRIYLYNKDLPNNSLNRLGRDYKAKLLNIITQRPKKPLYENC